MAGLAEAFAVTNATNGTTASISVYVDSSNGSSRISAGLYADNSGHPGALLTSGSLSSPKAGVWNDVSVSSTTVTAGRKYWIAVLGTSGTMQFRDRYNGGCVSENSAQSTLGSLPGTWKSGPRYTTCPISAYVNGYLTTAPAALLPPAAPSNTVLPAISGTTTDGQVLSTGNGSWNGSPAAYAYQWRQCDSSGASCSDISGATSASDKLTTSSVGQTLRVIVTATNAGGSGSATSAQTAVVANQPPAPPPAAPVNTVLPTISGTPQEGNTLTGADGTWTGSPTSYRYQWQLCDSSGANCSNIDGATATTYALDSGDVGHTIRGTATATNGGGSTSATTAATAVVTATTLAAPSNTGAPAITGTAQQASTLTASNGTWSGSPTSSAYQWRQCDSSGNNCTNIAGATASSYTLAAGDVSHTFRVVVTGTNAGGSTPATSTQTAIIASSGTTSCTLHATTANFTTTFGSAPGGSVICLASGNYGTFSGGAKSSMVTIQPESGASVTMTLSWNNVSFVTVTGVTLTEATIQRSSHDDAVTHSTVASSGQMIILNDQMNASSNLVFDHDTFANQSCGSGIQGRFDIQAAGPNNTNPLGVTISNSLLSGGTADGVRIDSGSGVQVLNNEFTQFNDVDPCHTDPIQLYGGSHVIVKGNWFHNMSNSASCSFAQWDGGDHNLFENNVVDGTSGCSDGAAFLADSSSTIRNNVFYNADIDLGSKGAGGTGTIITNNVIVKGISNGDGGHNSSYTATYNVSPSAMSGTGNVTGSATYAGGHPSTWAGFALAAGSAGIGKASDGTNIGLELPTGG